MAAPVPPRHDPRAPWRSEGVPGGPPTPDGRRSRNGCLVQIVVFLAIYLATGLLYAYTKRPSIWGVSAWYLSAIDVATGREQFSVRTGTGTLMNNHYAAITLGPDGAAYIATLGGMVRVKDAERD